MILIISLTSRNLADLSLRNLDKIVALQSDLK